eukprot:471784-Pelagomonas_calceolata.AAC.1
MWLTVWGRAVLAAGESMFYSRTMNIKEGVAVNPGVKLCVLGAWPSLTGLHLGMFAGACPVWSFDHFQPVGRDSGGLPGELSWLCMIVLMRPDCEC